MGYLGPAAAHAVKLASQVLSESCEKNERHRGSTDLKLVERFCTAVAKPPHNFLRNLDYK